MTDVYIDKLDEGFVIEIGNKRKQYCKDTNALCEKIKEEYGEQ